LVVSKRMCTFAAQNNGIGMPVNENNNNKISTKQ
jgi:hypothetical protein